MRASTGRNRRPATAGTAVDAPFEQALSYGVGEFEMHKQKKEVTTFDVAKLRKLGVTPQPVD